ncbi:hypothetical protein LCGC14_2639700 [marine sediment metagenome]|uniref:Uncharacterized protein n=1 Tax=marine sediment metagenome TaxID=412755 RepID=A0A0F9AKB2_9ZZZZ
MKFRTGFVSNSSNTSFCIYGHCFGDDDTTVEKMLIEKGFIDNNENRYCYDMLEDNEAFKAAKLSFQPSPYGDYVGRSWDSIGDDETGREFKESTKKAMEEFFGEGIELDYCEESFNDNY